MGVGVERGCKIWQKLKAEEQDLTDPLLPGGG